jgi:hypothetical protein
MRSITRIRQAFIAVFSLFMLSGQVVAEERQPPRYIITEDSTRLVASANGLQLIGSDELQFELPDNAMVPSYIMPPDASSRLNLYRRLTQFAVSPNDSAWVVAARDAACHDVILKFAGEPRLFLIGCWHHEGVDSMFWSPDGDHILLVLGIEVSDRSKFNVIELTGNPASPVAHAATWFSEHGWIFADEAPTWDTLKDAVEITLKQVPLEGTEHEYPDWEPCYMLERLSFRDPWRRIEAMPAPDTSDRDSVK